MPPAIKDPVNTSSPLKAAVCSSFHLLSVDPKDRLLLLGITLLSILASIVTVSIVDESPKVISPSRVIFPVASILPNTSKSLKTFSSPLP